MSDIRFTEEAGEIFEKFLKGFPAAIRSSYKQKVLNGLEYYMLKHQMEQATKEALLSSIEQSFPKSFEPVIIKYRSPEKLSEIAESQRQINPENPSVRVRRWDIPRLDSEVKVKKVMALMAGPRRQGNTDCILDALLDGIKAAGSDIDKVYISDLVIAPCKGCMACEKKELETFCAIKDDMTDLYRKFIEYDAFVMAYPVYTSRECSQAAVFFDRLKALRTKGQFHKLAKPRKGALVVTWGWPSEHSYDHVVESSVFILKMFGVDTAEIVTGSGFWDAYYKKGTAKLDKQGMKDAVAAGRSLVES